MSKLFDQLKDAARSREEKSPGLLLEALQRSQDRDPNTAAETAPVAPAGDPVAPGQASAQSPRTSYAGIALAALILAVAWLAWNATPWRPPQKLRIDPATLKLDRSFQVDRPSPTPRRGPEGTSRPFGPS